MNSIRRLRSPIPCLIIFVLAYTDTKKKRVDSTRIRVETEVYCPKSMMIVAVVRWRGGSSGSGDGSVTIYEQNGTHNSVN